MTHPSLFKRISTRLFYFLKYENPVAQKIKKRRTEAELKTWRSKVKEFGLSIDSCEQTISDIIDNKKSISRFGDGELRLLLPNQNLYFQQGDEKLVAKLNEALNAQLPNLIVGLNEGIIQENQLLKIEVKNWWKTYLQMHGVKLLDLLPRNRHYGNANITRFYIDYNSLEYSKRIVKMLKQIWNDKDVVIVEGEYSRLGVGNNLFSNASSLQRIICPSKNAFSNYDEILQSAKEHGKNKLIIIALGPTATVLAYDLAKEGYWALDMGHIDVEYMWMKLGATERVSLPGKAVSESKDRDSANYYLNEIERSKYENSIIKKIN